MTGCSKQTAATGIVAAAGEVVVVVGGRLGIAVCDRLAASRQRPLCSPLLWQQQVSAWYCLCDRF